MKKILVIFLSVVVFSSVVKSQTKNIEVIETDLTGKNCKRLEYNLEEGGSREECQGVGNYKLILLSGRSRESLDVVAPNGNKFELDIWSKVTVPKPSYLVKKVEWRVVREGEIIKPFALIVQFKVRNTYEYPVGEVDESYLVVSKIAGEMACITDVVEPAEKKPTEKARELADASADKPCRGYYFEMGSKPDSEDFSNINAFLKSVLKDKKGRDKLNDEKKGDLNGDGLEDWAGVIGRERAETGSSSTFETLQLYVLLQQSQGGYRLAAKSREEAYTEGIGGALYEGLEIKKSSIYLTLADKTYGSHEVTTYQFKLYRGIWRLIGVSVFYLVLESDMSIENDLNLLTGAVIEKRQKGENKPVVKRRQKKYRPFLLKDFDFYQKDFHFNYGNYGLDTK